ncbi:MAG: prepilin-type N-terminal cleavage/methylation domain-containing protein [candidate division WWE3 bacterium]|nr:prepilin-type N-terminal cleavage/methylation domain-containing protein [candidate division WWE3 bacterium]
MKIIFNRLTGFRVKPGMTGGVGYEGGFTLVELLIVIAVMVVIFAAIIPSFNNFTKSQYLEQATQQLINDLRSAQSKAQQGVSVGGATAYCWFLLTGNTASSAYTVGTSNAAVCTASNTVSTLSLPNSISFKDAGGKSIYFNQLTGSLNNAASTITIQIGNDTVNKCVNIDPSGNIYATSC